MGLDVQVLESDELKVEIGRVQIGKNDGRLDNDESTLSGGSCMDTLIRPKLASRITSYHAMNVLQ